MDAIHAAQALLPDGWHNDVRLVMEAGRIAAVQAGVPAEPGDKRCMAILPGMPNLHSHAFQRGMAGLAEVRGLGPDSFWSWREVMYRFALAMTPEQAEAVAAQLYIEMLEAGFTRVGEFHYLHHDRDGQPYGDVAEMAGRIAAAAEDTGIGLTLLPVFYAQSGFGGAAPNAGQRRFVSTLDGFAHLGARCREMAAVQEGMVVGVAPHSLRAVTPEQLAAVAGMLPGAPVHIHVAEQVREVEDCLAWSGARPVEWLLAHVPVDCRWTLIHATHMTAAETRAAAETGAIAGLCPITEANLGDGTFPVTGFRDAGGRFGIGSDSNVFVGVADELRQLEYSQRLGSRARNVVAAPGRSTGGTLVRAAFDGGVALGAGRAAIEMGAPADVVALAAGPDAAGVPVGDALLDAWIFAHGIVAVDAVWVRGTQQVERGRHRRREAIGRRFRSAMRELA